MSRLEDVIGNAIYREFGSVLAHDPHDPERFWGGATANIARAIEDEAGGPDHIVHVKGAAWTIQHPLSERFEHAASTTGLFGCKFSALVAEADFEEDGKFRVWLDRGALLWEPMP
jgi:hypothetical protein